MGVRFLSLISISGRTPLSNEGLRTCKLAAEADLMVAGLLTLRLSSYFDGEITTI
jgi:hypothetical protein